MAGRVHRRDPGERLQVGPHLGRAERAVHATVKGWACATESQKASIVCPDNVRPLRSVMVTEIISGTSGAVSIAAAIAAFAFSVSKIVSINKRSTPPSTSPRICSAYAAAMRSNVTVRYAGSFTRGDSDGFGLVGPTEPATNRSAPNASTARRAIRAPATFRS